MGNRSTQNALTPQLIERGAQRFQVVVVFDDVWFHVPTLASALQYDGPSALLAGVPAIEVADFEVAVDGDVASATFLSEPGFYRVAQRRARAEDDELVQWVFQTVLPKLRRTGQFRLHEEARRLGVQFQFTDAQWEWLKLRPYLVDILPLAAAGFNSVEITRHLSYRTAGGATARAQIRRLKELGFLPEEIEPREQQLERRIRGELAARPGRKLGGS